MDEVDDPILNDNPTQRSEPVAQHIGDNGDFLGLAHENFTGIQHGSMQSIGFVWTLKILAIESIRL